MRSLWTGASGMIAQQTNVDAIANNLANVNTVGYKKETVEFKTLLYSKLQTKTTDNNGNPKPIASQVGAGVRLGSITSRFTQGMLNQTSNPLDFAIEGDGFFRIMLSDGQEAYTRNGSFQMAIGTEGLTMSTSDGYPVLNTEGEPIVFPFGIDGSKLEVEESGKILYPDDDGEMQFTGIQIGLAQFNNPGGLDKIAGSNFKATDASGEPRYEGEDEALKFSKLKSSYLEGSNVSTVDEMVNLIVAQRAYEMNSKIITASDEMLSQANSLRR